MNYKDILESFKKAKINFVVIGGFAAIAHGVVRVTMDLDLAIIPKKSDLEKIWDELTNLGFKIRQPIRQKDFIDPVKLIKITEEKNALAISFINEEQNFLVVDFLFNKEFQLKDSDVDELNLFGIKVPIINLKKLIQLKKSAGRPKDLEDLRVLEKLKK